MKQLHDSGQLENMTETAVWGYAALYSTLCNVAEGKSFIIDPGAFNEWSNGIVEIVPFCFAHRSKALLGAGRYNST